MNDREQSDNDAQIPSDDLEDRVRALLTAHGLPTRDWEVDAVGCTIECARTASTYVQEQPRMPDRAAKQLRNATETTLKICKEYGVMSHDQLKPVRRAKRSAEVDLLRPPTPPSPKVRPWLWYWCLELLDDWRAWGEVKLAGNGRQHQLHVETWPIPV